MAAKLPPAGVATVNSNPVPAAAYEEPNANVVLVLVAVVSKFTLKRVALSICETTEPDAIPVPETDIPTTTLAVLSICIILGLLPNELPLPAV